MLIDKTHEKGLLTIDNPEVKGDICSLSVKIAVDGRIWICVNGQSFIRFKPLKEE